MNSYERVMAALDGNPYDRTPVSMMTMAWAGHYIGKSFREYILEPEVLVNAHLALVRDLGMDTVSVQSDPWSEAEAYGMRFTYPDEAVGMPEGHLLDDDFEPSALKRFDPHAHQRTRDRIEAIRLYAREIKGDVPIIGWVEGPIAEYADLRGLQEACLDLFEAPDRLQEAFACIVDNAAEYAIAQIEAGADIIGVGDAAASVIGPVLYEEHVKPWEKILFTRIREAGAKVKVHICGNIVPLLPGLSELGIDILDIDSMVPLAEARAAMGEQVTLCGNFNPVAEQLRCTADQARTAAERCIAEGGHRFILQGGCETPPETPLENVKAAFAAAGA